MSKKIAFISVFLILTQWAQAQLSNFTLTVTPFAETCTANGSLSFTVSNTVSGANMVYSIYKLPNITVPVAIVSTSPYTGLTAGDYLVIATQSLGAQSGTQQQQVAILHQSSILTYTVSSEGEICGNDAVITINTITGTAVSYEIIAGPIVRPLQTSNVFTSLASGQYTIRVFDACGEGVVQTYTVISKNPALTLTAATPSLAGCNSVTIGFSIATLVPNPVGVIKYPIQVVTTVTPPTGSPIVTSATLSSGDAYSTTIPLFSPTPYNYSFTITDGCGVHYTVSGVVNNLGSAPPSYTLINVSCTTKKIKFTQITGLVLLSAPATYPNPVPQDFTAQIVSNGYTTVPLGVGTYVFQVTNICGQTQTISISIEGEAPSSPYCFPYQVVCATGNLAFYFVSQIVLVTAPAAYTGPLPYDFSSTINAVGTAVLTNLPAGTYTFNVLDRCGEPTVLTGTIIAVSLTPSLGVSADCSNTGTSTLNISGQLLSVILTAAPAAYTTTLPQNLTAQIFGNLKLTLTGLPPGTYSFAVTNGCNLVNTVSATVQIPVESTAATVIQNCGSFNLELHHTSTGTGTSTFWLQKYYTAGSDWGHPGTAVLQGTNLPGTANALSITNNVLTLNLPYSGQFRIVKVKPVYVPGSTGPDYCFEVINQFQTNNQPEIISLSSVPCNGTFDVVVNATGFGPLTYKISTKNGLPFVIDNGTSNLFNNLAEAVYNFQVTDFCGNIVNSILEVNLQSPFELSTFNLCPNETAALTVPAYGFLTYQWWNNNNPSTILSVTNSLAFPNFNPVLSAGTYSVHITYVGNPNSCLNTTLSYTISSDGFLPNAGNDNAVSYCGAQGILDLFSLLQGGYDTNGTWQVVTNNTVLNGSLWDSSAALPALYKFKYHVNGLCSTFDEAMVNVTLKAIPDVPLPSVNPLICDSQNIELFAISIPNATYMWTGPNGFSSTNQNPVISDISTLNSGVYSVKATLNGCESATAEVTVGVNPLPAFTLESKCDGGRFTITAFPLNNSFEVMNVTYAWSGPNGYSSVENPIDVTQLPIGDYSLTVTDVNGCSSTETIPVTYTFCEVPNVITPNGDGLNNSLNLSGLDVEKLEIYNRWGRKVYEKGNYRDEWHGQNMQGGQLPDSTYYYYIKLRDGEKTMVGWIFVNGTN